MDEKQLAASVRHFLAGLDDAFATDLAGVLRSPLPPKAALLDFQFSLDDSEFALVGFLMDRNAGQHGNLFLLRDADLSWPSNIAEASDNDDEDRSAGRVILDEVVTWLANGWAKAGGIEAGIAAYACQHDDLRSYDLAARRWVDDTQEKWA